MALRGHILRSRRLKAKGHCYTWTSIHAKTIITCFYLKAISNYFGSLILHLVRGVADQQNSYDMILLSNTLVHFKAQEIPLYYTVVSHFIFKATNQNGDLFVFV